MRLLLDMVFHTVRLSGNGHDMRMMQDPVKDRVGVDVKLKMYKFDEIKMLNFV